jgi:predicted cupin superfamily sugar epimerase
MALNADQIISLLGLQPHPEGGHFKEMYRDPRLVDGRSVSTAIYFLLKAGEISAWHRVDAAEAWHWYSGAPLELAVGTNGAVARHVLGDDLAAGERPLGVVPTGAWQQARSLGAWTLVGCTVAPAFVFEGFEMAGPDFDPAAA